jgi:hypothetical protein
MVSTVSTVSTVSSVPLNKTGIKSGFNRKQDVKKQEPVIVQEETDETEHAEPAERTEHTEHTEEKEVFEESEPTETVEAPDSMCEQEEMSHPQQTPEEEADFLQF